MLIKSFEAVLAAAPWLCAMIFMLLMAERACAGRVRVRAFRTAWLVLAVRAALPVQFTLPHAPAAVALPVWSEKPVTVLRTASETAAGVGQAQIQPPVSTLSLFDAAAAVWAAGAAVLALLFAVRYIVFTHRLYRSRTEIPGRKAVYTTPLAVVPFAHGLLRPAVYLPEHTEPGDLPYILAHERRHICAGDLWLQIALLAAQCMQWFNPAIHLMAHAARSDMELACDEAVLSGQDMAYRVGYAQAILNAMRRAKRQAIPAMPLCGRETGATRWKEIFNLREKQKGHILSAFACVAVLAASLLTGYTARAAEPVQSMRGSPLQSVASESASEDPAAETIAETQSAPEPESGEIVWPVPEYTYLARGYMEEYHCGLDICAAADADILAVQGGRVAFSGTDDANGNYVQIDCGDGLVMRYTHCNELYVEEGQTVKTGERIAAVGSTGKSTGNHCHVEMERDGVLFDPAELLTIPR